MHSLQPEETQQEEAREEEEEEPEEEEEDDDDEEVERCLERLADPTLRYLCSSFGFHSLSKWKRRRQWLWRVVTGGQKKSQVIKLHVGCAPAAARLLDLKEYQLRHLYRVFQSVDLDGSGSISVVEFLKLIDTIDTPFVRVFIDQVVFDFADLNTDGQLNFSEFLIAATAICSLSRKELLFFLFRMFDTDKSGAIEHREFAKLASAVGDMGSLFPGNYAQFFDKFDANDDGEIDFTEFLTINDRFPMLFFPASRLQDNFRRATFRNPDAWVLLSRKFSETHEGDRFHRRIAEIGRSIKSGRLPSTENLGGSFSLN